MTPRRPEVLRKRGRLRAAAPRAEARARRRRLMTIGAAFVLTLAVVALFNQYKKTYALARDEARLEQRRLELITDNARLRDEIERLRTDDRYIEQIARQQLGLVRPGEVELLVVPYEGTVSMPGAARRGGTAARASAGDGSRRDAAGSRPRRGIGVWAVGVRDAVLRLLRTPHR